MTDDDIETVREPCECGCPGDKYDGHCCEDYGIATLFALIAHAALAASRGTEETPVDPTEGLPLDLARVLRDHSIIVPQDAGLWEMLARWRDAPSDTASAGDAS